MGGVGIKKGRWCLSREEPLRGESMWFPPGQGFSGCRAQFNQGRVTITRMALPKCSCLSIPSSDVPGLGWA